MKLLREYIQYLLQERIVNFDGIEYDVPDEEIQRIKDQLQMGYVGIGMDPEPPDRSYDVDETVESFLKTVPEENQESVRSVLNVYEKSLKNTLVKTIYNYGDEVSSQFFSISPAFGDHSFPSSAWNDIVNIHQPGRSNAIGRGEAALALALSGVVPDSGSGVHDLEIEGLGGVHVKDTGASGGLKKPDVPMGKGLSGKDMSRPWYQSVRGASKKAGFKFGRGLGTTLLQKNSKAILDEFAALTGDTSQNYDVLADAWEADIIDSFRNSESWGDSGAIIFVDKGGLGFSIVPPEEAYPTRIENNGWRVGKASAYPGGRFATALKAGTTANEGLVRECIRALLTEDPMGFVHDLSAASDEFGEWEGQEFFGGNPGKGGGRAIKRAFNANADHQWLSTQDTVHWGDVYGFEDLIGKGKDELSATMTLPGEPFTPAGKTTGLWIKGRITLAANDMDQLYSGHSWEYGIGKSLGGDYKEVSHRDKSSGRNKRPTTSKDYSRYGNLKRGDEFAEKMARNMPYVLDQSTWHKGIAGETNEALVDNWKPIGIVVGKWVEPIKLSVQSLSDKKFKDNAGVNAPGVIGKIFKLATELGIPIFDRGRNELWSPG